MNKWIKTSNGQTEMFINTASIISIEYHKLERYMRIGLADGKTTIWRPLTEDDKIEMERFYSKFLDDINQNETSTSSSMS